MKNFFKIMSFVALASLATGCISVDETDDNANANTGGGTTPPVTGATIDPTNFQGSVVTSLSLQANVIYKLTGPLTIEDGATLNIPAGTRIEATGGTSAYIVVAQGGKLNVSGTSSEPVIMTSANANPAPGNWGGLVICGKAPINSAASASAEVSGLTYGGNIPTDNSGSIRYLRIEYAGAIYNANKEFNSLSLFGVGSGTTLEYIQAYRGSDDGFEFFGGTVNTSNLISTYNEDDLFDWTEGWSGTNTNWYGKQEGTSNRGIEADNLEANFDATPIANPTITNITLVGVGAASGEPDAIKLRRGTKAIFSNVVLDNFTTGFNIEHDQTLAFIPASLKANNVTLTNVVSAAKGKNTAGNSVDVSNAIEITTTATGAGNGTAAPAWANGWAKFN